MPNQKYFIDIASFPKQFEVGVDLANEIKINGQFAKAIVCGMGGSSSYVDLINDFKQSENDPTLPIFCSRSYSLPSYVNDKTLVIVSSYSGNTEESIACFNEALKKKYAMIAVTSGGALLRLAKMNNVPVVIIPSGIQPRLSAGFFICSVVEVLSNCGLVRIDDYEEKLLKAANQIKPDLEKAKTLALKVKNKVPILYSTDENSSLARLMKIKFNENSKTQSFWNCFPELNHNEMVGFSKMVMNPSFIIFKSKFTHPRNYKRIEIFTKLMRDKNLPVEIVDMQGQTILQEILNAYNFIDYVTYYLAEAYGIDPEPVAMVEDFKKMIE
jgi:glucose/mannose-6-phosphate isomerase